MLANGISPIVRNPIHQRIPHLKGWGSVHRVPSQIEVIPSFNRVESRFLDIAVAPSTGKYELTAECHNLAVRVVWFGSGILVNESAIGGHYHLVLRKIKNNNRSMTDLGRCRVRYKHSAYHTVFPHVTLSSGDASFMEINFDHSDEQSPTCWGCTLLVSYDGKHWYEIIAIQEVLTPSKRDP
jgi:hypothetical protein